MTDTVSLEDRVSLVKQQPVFAKLEAHEHEEIASLFVEKEVKAGDTIVTQGKPVDSVLLIVSGAADVRVITVEDGALKESSVAELKGGQAIGLSETGFYSLSGKRTATVVAKTDMVLLSLSVASFNGYALSNSHVREVMRKNSSNMVDAF